jgi:hypothetical protein
MGNKKKVHAGKPCLKVRIPNSIISVENLVASNELSVDRMRVVLHNLFLCMRNARMQKKNKNTPWLTDGYFAVHNSILQQVATSRYRAYLQILENADIIERKLSPTGGKNYLPGVHSQLFRFKTAESTLMPPSFRVEHVKDYRCIKSVLATNARYNQDIEMYGRTIELNPNHLKLREFVSQARVDTAIVTGIMKSLGHDPDNDPYDEIELDYLKALNTQEFFRFSVDSYGQRCHHPFTNLKSEYRPAIRYQNFEDIPLVHLDIKTSQPYFVGVLAAVGVLDKFLPEFAPLKPLITELSVKPDYTKYMEMCATDDIYEHIASLMGKSVVEIKQNRSEIKQQFYRAVLFSKRTVYDSDKLMSDVFRNEFPSVYRFFAGVRKLNEDKFPELKDTIASWQAKNKRARKFDKLACAAQRIEARFVTQYIASRLIDEADIGPFITIHDSYLLLPGHQKAAINIIEDSFRRFHIPPPRLKVEVLKIYSKPN